MTNKVTRYSNPKFKNADEEDRYWETHSPLSEGYEGQVQASAQKMSSFLSIRMSAKELTELREAAAKFDMKPSMFVRLILKMAIGQKTLEIQNPLLIPPFVIYQSLYEQANKEGLEAELSQKPKEPLCKEAIENIEKFYCEYIMKQKELIDMQLIRYHDEFAIHSKKQESPMSK